MQKVQITLTPEETAALSVRSKKMGFSVSKYIRFLVAKETHDVILEQQYNLSPKLERYTNEAIAEYKEGKSMNLSSPVKGRTEEGF